jgi:hypothetical protein
MSSTPSPPSKPLGRDEAMRRLSIIAIVAGLILTQPATAAAAADGLSAQHASQRATRRRGSATRRPRRHMRGNRSKVRRGGDSAAAESRPGPLDPSGQPMEELIVPEEYRHDDPRAKKRPPARRTRVRTGKPDIRNP